MNKYFIKTALMLAFLSVSVLMSCKKDDDGDVGGPSVEDEILAALEGTWVASEVKQNGIETYGDWSGFKLTFNLNKTYTSSGAPSEGEEAPFPNVTDKGFTILLSDAGTFEGIALSEGPELSDIAIGSTLSFSFNYDSPSSRVLHIGSYTLVMTKE